jgi:hypothetical protein
MRPLLRLVACFLAVVSLALLVLCVRSFWRNDSLFIENGPRGYFVSSARGRMGIIEVSGSWHPRRFHYAVYDLATDGAVLTTIARSKDTKDLGILLSGNGKLPGVFGQSRWIAIPYLTPLVPCAALPVMMTLAAWRRRRRKRRGLCGQCGYDLRGSSDVCPECGTAAARAMMATPTRAAAG